MASSKFSLISFELVESKTNPVSSFVAGILRFMGLEVASYTSDLSDDERAAMIAQFNDPKTRLDVLLLNINFNVTGLNLQMACNHGVAICFSYSPSNLRQALKRIHRIGQKKIVYWFLIKQVGGYSEVQERMIHVKLASFLSAQANIPWEIRGELRDIICFELAREEWGTLESKYVWARHAAELRTMVSWSQPWLKV